MDKQKETDIKNTKKCPKCGTKMRLIFNDFLGYEKRGEYCDNPKCWFYGISREIR